MYKLIYAIKMKYKDIELFTAIVGGVRSKKYKHHPNHDIDLAIMTTNGVEHAIESFELSILPHCEILNDNGPINKTMGIYIEVSYVDKLIPYSQYATYRVHVDNPDQFIYANGELILKLNGVDGFINYMLLSTPKQRKENRQPYPEHSQFRLVLTEIGINKMTKFLEEHFHEFI